MVRDNEIPGGHGKSPPCLERHPRQALDSVRQGLGIFRRHAKTGSGLGDRIIGRGRGYDDWASRRHVVVEFIRVILCLIGNPRKFLPSVLG